jgi:hypothetical protein
MKLNIIQIITLSILPLLPAANAAKFYRAVE